MQVENDDHVWIFDDKIEEQSYTDEHDLFARHFNHSYSAFGLEVLSLKLKMNYFEFRAKRYTKALKASFDEPQLMRWVTSVIRLRLPIFR